MDPTSLILVTFRDDLRKVISNMFNCSTRCIHTSIISSRGNSRNGISAALHAIR